MKSLENRSAFEKVLVAVDFKIRLRTFIERTQGPILMIAGTENQVWPAPQMVKEAKSLLTAANRPYRDEAYIFRGDGLDFTVPGFSTLKRFQLHEPMGEQFAPGGTPEASGHASRKAWEAIMNFLNKI